MTEFDLSDLDSPASALRHLDAMIERERQAYNPMTIFGTTRVVQMGYGRETVRIDRSGPWGNPYMLKDESQREAVIRAYLVYLTMQRPLLARVHTLRGERLGCWCAPKLCHGNLLALLAEGVPLDTLDLFF